MDTKEINPEQLRKQHRPSTSARRPTPVVSEPTLPPTAPVSSLARQSMMLQGLVVAAGALVAIYLMFTLHQLLRAQSLFEAAQQQRIYNQRYAKEILLSASGVPVSHEKTAGEWGRTLTLLTEGGELQPEAGEGSERVHPPMNFERFQSELERMAGLRDNIVRESTDFLESAKLHRHREALFDELYRQSLELQAAGDALIHTYDKHLDSGVSWWDVNAVAVELAERQRMLIQQHIKEILFVAHGIPADYQTTRLRLYETAKILTEGGVISIDNKEAISIPAPGSADVRFNLEQQKDALDRFTAVSNQYLMLANEDVERSIQLKKIQDLTGEFHQAATELIRNYRTFYAGNVRKAEREAAAAGLVAAVFALILGWAFMRKYVDLPVARMTGALRALRAGKAPAGGSLAGSDAGPVNEMGRELEGVIGQWQSRQTWFDQFLSAESADSLQDPGSQDPVASRVYQWYKTRGTEAAPIRSRWDADEKSDAGITIVGRLPDVEPSALVNDSELLDQLIRRANELQSQHEQLSRLHGRLTEETESLRASESRLQESESRLLEENRALRQETSLLTAQINEQLVELIRLRAQSETLQISGSAVEMQSSRIQKICDELSAKVAQQAEELKGLREQLADRDRQLRQNAENLNRSAEELHRSRELHEELSGSEQSLRNKIREEQESIFRLTGRLAEAEREMADLKLSLERASETARLESEKQALLSGRIAALESDLTLAKSAREQEKIDGARLLLQARNEYESVLHSAAQARTEFEAIGLEQLQQIRRQETQIADLQDSVARQTRLLEMVRAEFSEAATRHAGEIAHRDEIIRRSETAFGDLQSRLEGREAELWQLRKELADRQQDLTAARHEIGRLSAVEADQAALLASMRTDLARIQQMMDSKSRTIDEMDAVRRNLEHKISQAEAAYRDKCQALVSAEERLSATRTALKTTLEELQERSQR